MSADLTDPIFHDEDKAREHFEAIRWPNGPVCPHCGVVNEATLVKGKSHRAGMYQCNACREPFTVMVGSVMESSHLPLTKWALGFHLMAASKKGVSAHQLMRMLGIGSYRTAWFMAHRIREAMKTGDDDEPLGGRGKTVEVDETFIGKPDMVFVNGKGWQHKRGVSTKRKVISLVERGGRAKSIKVNDFSQMTIRKVLSENIIEESTLNTDEAHHYKKPGERFFGHESVNHSDGEYARGETTTNTVEGFFSIFKRGMTGVYQHCGDNHLQAYLHEFDFRYSNRVALGVDDTERAKRAIKGAAGKRLTYRPSR
ncbi:Transposase [Rhizobiales bacterium GAS113]|nr:Transposase [Rhizobiales bacterium GAS113]